MEVVGYSDRMSVEPGRRITFMVSTETGAYRASIVRLFHGDPSPHGPGFDADVVPSSIDGEHTGSRQPIRSGSYVEVSGNPALDFADGFSLFARFWATTPNKDAQTLVSQCAGSDLQYALRLDNGMLSFAVGPDPASTVALDQPVAARTWYAALATYDARIGRATLKVIPRQRVNVPLAATADRIIESGQRVAAGRVLIAAEARDSLRHPSRFYNGKLEGIRLYPDAIDADATDPDVLDADLSDHPTRVAWDFSRDIPTSIVRDVAGCNVHGRAINRPMRAATGWSWDGTQCAWPLAPTQYAAIHFHDDDLDDAGWAPSIEWQIPPDLPSGVYALHLASAGTPAEESSDAEDFVPFVVRPRRIGPNAPIVFLMPTFSYLAYANVGGGTAGKHTPRLMEFADMDVAVLAAAFLSSPQDRYIVANHLTSLYDNHTDGSGVCYSSRLRPLMNMRPKYYMAALNNGAGSPHQFNADLHLIDWLHVNSYDVDVVTDDDLHAEGASLLAPYKVVITGTHCEYWSAEMLSAAREHLERGGRMMYLAGNGMYWVTQLDSEGGHTIEIRRRGPSTRAWEPQPGEAHLSTSGELGGLWRHRGLAPQSWLGVGFTAQGLGPGRPYTREAASFDDRVAWVFEGIGDDELIGDFPSLVNGYGAASFEIDRIDHDLGTPVHTHHLASATGFSDSYQHASEEVLISDSMQGGTVNPLVRADMVLLEYPNGGAVFSPGSIGWSACLSYNDYDNNVGRITANVLNQFLQD